MDIKRRPNLGNRIHGKLYFSAEEKRIIIQDYLSGNESKREVFERYTGYSEEHGKLLKWMRQYGISDKYVKSSTFTDMSKKKSSIAADSKDFEKLQLTKRVEELEKKLKEAEMKAIAFSTMVDIAEKEYKIPIRKKYNTKPSK